MLSERDEYIRIQLDETFRSWIAKAALYAALLVAVFGAADSIWSPEGFTTSFLSRVFMSGFLLCGYGLVKWNILSRYTQQLAVLWVVIVIFFLEFAVFSQRSEIRFIIGNIVAAVVAVGFIPARMKYVLIMAICMLAIFFLPLLLGSIDLYILDQPYTVFYYLVILCSLLIVRYLTERSVIHEFGMKYDLDQYRSGLEKTISARTEELKKTVMTLQHEIRERQKIQEQHQSLEEQLRQSQKMESIGRLAGGLAHDVNNILTTIISANSLAKHQLPPDHQVQRFLRMIDSSGDRAAGIMGQLLAFSRKQLLSLSVIDLNVVVADVVNMLERVIGEDIRIEFRPGGALAKTKADVTQVGQVIMNLALNARDAMMSGGVITIETADANASEIGHIRSENAKRDRRERFVRLSILDNGQGMTEDIKEQIFEPFFTTKGLSGGTGLGLAVVYGIITQHNGEIVVDSIPGKGTAFHVYLPATDELILNAGAVPELTLPRGTEDILLVEDDASILSIATEVLSSLGYSIVPASCGEIALAKFRSRANRVDMLLTDVVMPGMNGKVLAETLLKEQPSLKVMYMSGYTDDTLSNHGVIGPSVKLIQKPVRPETLAVAVRNVLDENEGDGIFHSVS